MTKDEALTMCLEYIETNKHERKYVRHAIKAALEQPAQEPVGWEHHEYRPYGGPGEIRIHAILASQYMMPDGSVAGDFQWLVNQYKEDKNTIKLMPLYTTLPAAQPVQEPTPWRDMVVVSLVREGINKHKARELADHFAAQPAQEPVACRFCHSKKGCRAWQCYSCGEIDDVQKPAPPAAQPVQKPVTDEQVKKLLLIGPVYAPDGVVTRTPFAYREELFGTALWAFRKAEAAHGIKEQS